MIFVADGRSDQEDLDLVPLQEKERCRLQAPELDVLADAVTYRAPKAGGDVVVAQPAAGPNRADVEGRIEQVLVDAVEDPPDFPGESDDLW